MGLYQERAALMGPPNEPTELPAQALWAYWANSRTLHVPKQLTSRRLGPA
jgi:hypothetical protein